MLTLVGRLQPSNNVQTGVFFSTAHGEGLRFQVRRAELLDIDILFGTHLRLLATSITSTSVAIL